MLPLVIKGFFEGQMLPSLVMCRTVQMVFMFCCGKEVIEEVVLQSIFTFRKATLLTSWAHSKAEPQ